MADLFIHIVYNYRIETHMIFNSWDSDMEAKRLYDLFMSNGKLNSAIIRRDWFKKSPLYKEIMEKSRELDIFKGVDIGHRIWFIKDGMNVGTCEKCGKPRLVMPKGHGNHVFTMCSCNRSFTEDSKRRLNFRRTLTRDKISADILSMSSGEFRLSSDDFKSTLAYMNSRPANYQFMICEKYKDFYSDLIRKTKDVLPIYKDAIDIPQRLYIYNNGLVKIPECPDCGRTLKFKNRFVGYAPCPCNELERSQATRAKSYLARIPTLIDTNRYDILEYPKRLSDGMKIRCKKCGEETIVRMTCGRLNTLNHNSLLCKHCENFNGTSKTEKDIVEFIRTIAPVENIVENDRSVLNPKELDIYIPSQKLAFEYDGLYWHCDEDGDVKKHLRKTLDCEVKGIHLVHVFENEWNEKQNIVKSRIRNLLGSYDHTIYARNCVVREIDGKESLEFQWKNHIQGGVNSKVNIGLYYEDELVSLMTFSKPRFSKKYEWELVRFCNKCGCHIPGGASKLLKHFERTYRPKSIVSYADRRWSMKSESTLYNRLGFLLVSESSPNYWYIKDGELFNRIQFQKHKLKDVLVRFDEAKSEWQNMQDNGYDRIFDRGNLVYVKLY